MFLNYINFKKEEKKKTKTRKLIYYTNDIITRPICTYLTFSFYQHMLVYSMILGFVSI